VGEGDVKDEREDASVSITGSRGVVAGTGNVQNNMWALKPPPDLASLSALNPHVAVSRLKRMSHDDLVDLFARASPDDATDVLAAFLKTDADTVVAILGDINRRKATALLEPLLKDFHQLVSREEVIDGIHRDDLAALPDMAEAIAREAASLRFTHAGVLECLEFGYSRRYREGRLFWQHATGVLATSGVIESYRADRDWLGFPVGNEEDAPLSPYGTGGVRQTFDGGKVYASRCGTFALSDVRFFEEEQDGVAGWLGFPITEFRKNDENDCWLQAFEGGCIFCYSVRGSKAYAVRSEIIRVLSNLTFRPVSKEIATESAFGTSGTTQRFELRQGEEWRETVIYSTPDHGTIIVEPEIWGYYQELGAGASRLGFPSPTPERWQELKKVPGMPRRAVRPALEPSVPPAIRFGPSSGAEPPRSAAMASARPAREYYQSRKRTAFQFFEGGCIYWKVDPGAFAVSGSVFDAIATDPQLRGKLGWPVSEERPIGPGESDRIQFFDNGNVTLLDGKREIWLRPEVEGPIIDKSPYARPVMRSSPQSTPTLRPPESPT
jgi:hypothetical protein